MVSAGRSRVVAADLRLFDSIAARHWPGADPLLPWLSRAADHGVLWFASAAALGVTRSPRARRAAARGLASLALASGTVNTFGKRAVRRARPLRDDVPLIRQLKHQPITTSFPSGHSASAAAFATGVALESRRWGAVIAPVAAAVALSRIYTGVHYPTDVLAGAALGVGAAFAVRGLVPTRDQHRSPGRPRADAPALADGEGLVMVVNEGAKTADRAPRALLAALPRAELVECEPAMFEEELEKAALRARVLGVCGGDGSVNTAARVALRHGLPLAVLPGGTLNHFAYDLGVEGERDLARALTRGEAVAVDVGRFHAGETTGLFLNTFSLGVYPELVRRRDRWSRRIGGWPAGVLAAAQVLGSEHPLEVDIDGRRRPLWLLFAGNGTYHRMGLTPARRDDLADGLLDVRVTHGGRRPGTRLLAAAFAGPLSRSPVHAAVRVRRLRVSRLAPGTPLAYDGEVVTAGGELRLEKLPQALTVYRPETS